jgi:hypothetical protein
MVVSFSCRFPLQCATSGPTSNPLGKPGSCTSPSPIALPGTIPAKEDTRHPKIKLLMDPYLERYNSILNLSQTLTLSGNRMTDLPSLPQYCQPTGQPFLCWNSVLGKCFRGAWCKYSKGHLKKGDATDAFAEALFECISKGVLYYTNLPTGASSPRYKRIGGGATSES